MSNELNHPESGRKRELTEQHERLSNVYGNWATFGGVIIALLFSSVSMWQSSSALSEARSANALAAESIQLTRDSSDRERGVRAPYISVRVPEDKITIDSEESLHRVALGLQLTNADVDPIDMARLQTYIVLASDFTHPGFLQDSYYRLAKHREVDWQFPETVRSGGHGKIDLKADILNQLVQMDVSKIKDHDLQILINITCAPRYVGQQSPTSMGLEEKPDPKHHPEHLRFLNLQDRDIVTIQWNPSKLSQETIKKFIETYKPERWVSN